MKLKKISLSLFFVPALFLIFTFIIFPCLQTISLSFVSPEGNFAGLGNYLYMLSKRRILNLSGLPRWPPWGAIIHTMVWMLIHIPCTVFLGLLLAVLLENVRGASIIKSVIFLAMVMPMIVGGIFLRFIYEKGVGLVPTLFDILGVKQLAITWTAHPETALFGLIFGSVWMWTGFSMILYSAGLTTIPKDYFEAAKIDGATPLRTFFRITLPLLKPITLTIIVQTMLWDFHAFDLVYAATMGGPGRSSTVLPLEMYFQGFVQLDFNRAAAIATIQTLMMLVLSVWMLKQMGKK